MSTHDLTRRLSTLAVESSALANTPHHSWNPTRITAAPYPFLPLSQAGRGKGAIAKVLYARAFGWSVVVAHRQGGSTSAGQLTGTTVNLMGYRRPIDVLLEGRS